MVTFYCQPISKFQPINQLHEVAILESPQRIKIPGPLTGILLCFLPRLTPPHKDRVRVRAFISLWTVEPIAMVVMFL